MKKAVVLLSGGLDSATVLAIAKKEGFTPYCLIFEYGQRHQKEISCAKKIAQQARCPRQVITIAFPWKGSSLLEERRPLPRPRNRKAKNIPSTYVPARNIIFLSFAASYGEAIGAEAIFIGANAIDYSGYPDCRPGFFKAYRAMLAKGTKAGVEGKVIKVYAPLVHKTKAQIIKMGLKLKVPYHLTWSCYEGGRKPCGRCDSCLLRQKGFQALQLEDPS
jgi:7-cyano-7-deazaguanine synthase